MTDFEKMKKESLSKSDKSSKGDIDIKIRKLCEVVNKSVNYFTLSSCSGRICLLQNIDSNNKKESKWLMVTHEKASSEEFWNLLSKLQLSERIDFKQESAIIHIQCREIEHAEKLIAIAKQSGFNRCGIITTRRKIVVELICSMPNSFPVYDEKLLIDRNYLEYLIEFSNNRLTESWLKIDRLEKEILKL